MRYSARLVEHFLHPRNAGLMRDPDGTGEDEFEGCGDLARIFIRVREGRAVEVRFQSYGCGPTIAAASAASGLIGGRVVEELVSLKGVLENHPGKCPVSIHLKVAAASDTVLALGDELAVDPGEPLLASLERLFGASVAELR